MLRAMQLFCCFPCRPMSGVPTLPQPRRTCTIALEVDDMSAALTTAEEAMRGETSMADPSPGKCIPLEAE